MPLAPSSLCLSLGQGLPRANAKSSVGHRKKTKGKGALTEPLSWAKAHLYICFTVSFYPHKEPERGGVISLVQMKILRLKELGFPAYGLTAGRRKAGARAHVHRISSPVLPLLHLAVSAESGRGNGRKHEKTDATPIPVDQDHRGERHTLTTSLQESAHPVHTSWALREPPPRHRSPVCSPAECSWSCSRALRWGFYCLL